MSKRVQVILSDQTAVELAELAGKLGTNSSQLGAMCLRAGMDVVKLATSQDYDKLMQLMGKEYDLIEVMKVEKKSRGGSPYRGNPSKASG